MNKFSFLKVISVFTFLLFLNCSDDTIENLSTNNNNIDTDSETSELVTLNTWKLAHGNGNSNAYSIGIIFEVKDKNQTDASFEKLIDEMVGNGDFSLFKTQPFDKNKDKFNVYYAILSKSRDQNSYPFSKEELTNMRDKAGKYFSENKQLFFGAKEPKDANNFMQNMASTVGFDFSKTDQIFSYADGFSLDNTSTTPNQKNIIQRNLNRFDNLFNQKQFDTQVYISPGVGQAYANTSNKVKKVYMSYEDYSLAKLVSSDLIHPNMLAITFTHEFGHAFALFGDEYYDYDPNFSFVSLKFQNNVVNQGFDFNNQKFDANNKASNPWNTSKIPVLIRENNGQGVYEYTPGPISNYNGQLVKGGPGGYGGYRASDNSIMRFYMFINNPNDWINGWNAVQQFYINYFIKKIN